MAAKQTIQLSREASAYDSPSDCYYVLKTLGGHDIDLFCPRKWERVTGFRLKPNEQVFIQIHVRKIRRDR